MKSKVLLFRWLFLPGIIFISIFCNSCKGKSKYYEPTYSVDTAEKKTLLFMVPTQAYYEMQAAFVNYLNEHLTGVHIRTFASAEFSAYADKVNKGLFDLALGNAMLALDGKRLGYSFIGEALAKEPNTGVILVHKDSLIRNFSDLKGKSIATPGSPALPGHVLQMVHLYKKGVDIKDIKLKYLESFESVMLNIYLGKCSAGFTSMTGWQIFLKKRPEIASKLALKWVTEAVPGSTLLVGSKVNEKTISELKNLLFTMHMNEAGRNALSDLGYTKFIAADSTSFLPVKTLLKEYNELIVDPKK